MKRFLSAFLMLALFACQKEKPKEETAPEVPPNAVCKVASIQEHPAVDGKSVLRTFTYDAANRVIKMDIKNGSNPLVTKNISYNGDGKIEKITYNNGDYEMFTYTNGVVSGWETFNAAGLALKKSALIYENGRMVRENIYQYNTATAAHELKNYLVYEWEGAGNIANVKRFSTADGIVGTDTYSYNTDKLNKQQTITPQLELLFLNWSNDITAFIYSKNLLKSVTSKKRNLVYEMNGAGWVTSIKTDKKDKLFDFTYGCSN